MEPRSGILALDAHVYGDEEDRKVYLPVTKHGMADIEVQGIECARGVMIYIDHGNDGPVSIFVNGVKYGPEV